MCPGVALPSKAPFSVDPGEHGDPGQGGVLPVGQTLLEGTAKLWAGLGILLFGGEGELQSELKTEDSEHAVANIWKLHL